MKFELDRFNRNVSDEDLLNDLISAEASLKATGKPLTFRTYREVGRFSPSTINDRFGSWNLALQKAGISLHEQKHVSVELLFDNLKLVWISKGRQPVFRDLSQPPSCYTASTYAARFGGWRAALAAFVARFKEEEQALCSSGAAPIETKRVAQTPRDPSLALRFLVLRRDNFRCVACGRSPATEAGVVLEVDHVVPWTNGGLTVAENLQTLCFGCNRGKGTGPAAAADCGDTL